MTGGGLAIRLRSRNNAGKAVRTVGPHPVGTSVVSRGSKALLHLDTWPSPTPTLQPCWRNPGIDMDRTGASLCFKLHLVIKFPAPDTRQRTSPLHRESCTKPQCCQPWGLALALQSTSWAILNKSVNFSRSPFLHSYLRELAR